MEELDFTLNNGCCNICAKGCGREWDNKLHTFDWLCGTPPDGNETDYVEVQFKNTRKGYYVNSSHILLEKGDFVAVNAPPKGYDIGTVTLMGKMAVLQMKKNHVRMDGLADNRIYRRADADDLKLRESVQRKEHTTMIRARQIAEDLGLEMKIGDVEYQGDGKKAIFYYIADGRVDFRQLIQVLADVFQVRIEMKQIGARQEAARIGGIGACGRELCCACWKNSLKSVGLSTARCQDLSIHLQKLAGQCAKFKCCINYEIDLYIEAQKQMPPRDAILYTQNHTYYFNKVDIFRKEITYSTDKIIAVNTITIPAQRAFDIIEMNKKGVQPHSLTDNKLQPPPHRRTADILKQQSLTRFDVANKKAAKGKKKSGQRDKIRKHSTQ